jgi:putative CocE/NonD family hydrolase
MQWGVKIPMRDGVRLNATLYVPRDQTAPLPTLFTATPYVSQMYHDQAVYFAANGLPFLTVDVRGRGNSEGEFHPIGAGQDGHDIVEWVARQPFCNGRVGMWGGSYSGYVQWATIKERPPHLAAIAPVASPYRGVDMPLRNNMFMPYTVQWLTLISGRTTQDRMVFDDRPFWSAQFRRWLESGAPFRSLDAAVGNPSALFQEWLAHPEQDNYWDRYNPTAADYGSLSIPVLTITGAYDANQAGALAHYRELMRHAGPDSRARHCLVIGPWDHAGTRTPRPQFGGIRVGPAALLDLRKLHLEWYEWALRGRERPSFLRKSVAYYVMGAEEWRHADSLEAVTAHTQLLYLHSKVNPSDVFLSGSLETRCVSGGGPDCYVYDPRDVATAAIESTVDPDDLSDQTMLHARRGAHLVYHSEPSARTTEICGFFRLTAWIALDQPDTDFRAAIYEIAADGSSVLLTSDTLRARYREGLRQAKLVHTREPLRYDFERFSFVARRLAAGSRVRLVIEPINSIYAQKNYNSGGTVADESLRDARTVTVRLFHDETHPSSLCVPCGSAER